MTLKIKALIIALVAAGLVGVGWQGRAWYEDSVTLGIERAMARVMKSNEEAVAEIAKGVQGQLDGVVTSERVIDRGIIREIEKPVYRDRECFEPEFVRLLNLGAQGPNADVSGEPAGDLPGDAADAE